MNIDFITNPKLPAWLLRGGLATVLIYAGISSLVTPEDWIGYLPGLVTDIIDGELFLKLFALYQLGLAVWLLSGYYLHFAALVALAMFSGILLGNLSLLAITFRDIVAICASAALASLSWPKQG
jgi:hypothetical protein